MHLDGLTVPAGHQFHFDLNLFDTETPATAYLVHTFAQLAREGLGPDRRKVELLTVEQVDQGGQACAVIYDRASATVRPNIPPLQLDLTATQAPV